MMKYIMVVLVLLSASGCAQRNHDSSIHTFEDTNFETGIKTTVHLQENELYIVVRNQYQRDYQVWVMYDFKSKQKNTRIEEMIHEGNEYQRNYIVTIPDDEKSYTRESVKILITSLPEVDIPAIIQAVDRFSNITGATSMGGYVNIVGFSVMPRYKYFQTPEIVLNGFEFEGSYGNSPKMRAKYGVEK